MGLLGDRVGLVRQPVAVEPQPQMLVVVADLQVAGDPLGQPLGLPEFVVPAVGGGGGEPVGHLPTDLGEDVVLGDERAEPADDGADLFGLHAQE